MVVRLLPRNGPGSDPPVYTVSLFRNDVGPRDSLRPCLRFDWGNDSSGVRDRKWGGRNLSVSRRD